MDTLSRYPVTRRSLILNAAGAGLAAAALPGLARASNYRGLVGDIKPRPGDSALVDMIKLLPDGIGVVPVYLDLKSGSRAEYSSAFPVYENRLAYLAPLKCNVISVEGAPPFMLVGPKREAEIVDGWKKKYNTDMFTSSQNQVNAFRALKVKKILGITSGSGGPEMEKVYQKYFEDCGFGVVAFVGMGVEFNAIQDVPPAAIAAFIKKTFNEHKGADAIYVLGSSLEALPLVEPLERELGVPMVQPIAARIWEIQRRLKVHEPIKGYGRLLETLPA